MKKKKDVFTDTFDQFNALLLKGILHFFGNGLILQLLQS